MGGKGEQMKADYSRFYPLHSFQDTGWKFVELESCEYDVAYFVCRRGLPVR